MRILILCSALILTSLANAEPQHPSKQTTAFDSSSTAKVIVIGDMQLLKKQNKSDDKKSRLTVDAEYPYLLQAIKKLPDQRFNDHISDIIETEVGQFRAMVDEVHGDQSLDELPNNGYSDMTIRYDIVLLTAGLKPLISILFTIDTFIGGGAHPNSTHRTINYDFTTGDAIAIAELFKNQPDFIPVLNNYCAKQLTKLTHKSEKEMVADNEINYSQWNITAKGLLVTFDEFPHVYGLQQVLVPYSVLGNVVKPNSIIERASQH